MPYGNRKVLLLSDGFGGATMAAYCHLRDRRVQTAFHPASTSEDMIAAVGQHAPDIVIAPTLTKRVPAELYDRVLINHPGRLGDRGPSSIDWGRVRRDPLGGNTVLLAEEGWDTGPVVYTTSFPYPSWPATKSWLYSHLNRAAFLAGIDHVLAGLGAPMPLDESQPDVLGRWNDPMRQRDCEIHWTMSAEDIVWNAAARDGSPGVLTELAGHQVYVYDVHLGGPVNGDADPGDVVEWQPNGAIRVAVGMRTGDGYRESVWVGYVKPKPPAQHGPAFKLPAAAWIGQQGRYLPLRWTGQGPGPGYRPIRISFPDSTLAIVTAAAYNGAWSTEFCQRVTRALAYVERLPDIRRVVLRGGGADPFGNGIHLNHIYAADPGCGSPMQAEARRNISAINEVAEMLFRLRRAGRHVIVVADGDAGAGGAFLSLCGSVVVAEEGRVLNYHYKSMGGLTGSEYHTLTLPGRMPDPADRHALLNECLPLSAYQAHRQGLVDYLAPAGLTGPALTEWIVEFSRNYGAQVDRRVMKVRDAPSAEAEAATSRAELTTIFRDFAGSDFQQALARFVLKQPATPPVAARRYRGGYQESNFPPPQGE
ncbi:enoyl-CoA hydratase-related protein [Micromonospora sp. NPDC048830]|uniref:enoyl-CoA hydratase-related protein n=1 Tax=Micromonospora sp. NPDC048830 TaxID=3364257 RepID=UPI00371FD6ED